MLKGAAFAGAMLLGAATAAASGFMQPNLSASGAGVANAFVATADDASAAAYNPAAAAWQEGLELSLGTIIDYRNSSATTAAGSIGNAAQAPNSFYLYGTWMALENDWGITGGFAPLYDARNEWGTFFGANSGNLRLTVDHGTLDAIYAVNSSLAFGIGADWYSSRMLLNEGAVTFNAKRSNSFGGHASLMWKFMPTWSLGLTARSGSNVKLKSGTNNLKLKLPDSLTLGIAHDFADVWRLETDVQWTRWSKLKDLNVTSGGAVVVTNPLNLRDTVSVMAGVTWTWRENSQVRFGYAYEQGASKTSGFNPLVADQDGHRISLGAGGDAFGLHLDAAYNYTFYTKKTVTGTFAGSYRDRRQSIDISASKRF